MKFGKGYRNKRSKLAAFPKWLKILVISSISFLFILIIGWFVLNWYVNTHKEELLSSITQRLSDQLSGKLHIEDMEPALLKTFPDVSVRLIDITLQDSLFHQHQRNTIELESIYIKLNIFSLFSKHPQIKKVTLYGGNIYLFKKKNEYGNDYLFSSSNKEKKESGKELEFHDFSIEQVNFTFDNFLRNKQFKADLRHIDGTISPEGDNWIVQTHIDAFIHQLGFNLDKGGFLKEKTFRADLNFLYDKAENKIQIPQQKILVDEIPFDFGAVFRFSIKPVLFNLDITALSVNFKQGVDLLSAHISSKFKDIDFKENIYAHALIDGSFAYPDTPLVTIRIDIQDNTLITPYGNLSKAYFSPIFKNHVIEGKGKSDDNSGISMNGFKGEFEGIPIEGDSTFIFGLVDPLIKTRIKSQFPVEKMNQLVGNSFIFKKGDAQFDLDYKGPLIPTNHFEKELNGFIKVNNASFSYVPRDLNFQNGQVSLNFKGTRVDLKEVQLSSEKSTIHINGYGDHFLDAYFEDPSKVVLDLNIISKSIDLNEFKSLMEPRKKSALKPSNISKTSSFNNQLDLVLEKSTFNAQLEIDHVNYRQFTASEIKGNLSLKESEIELEGIQVHHAGGRIRADAFINIDEKNNPVQLKADIEHVEVDKLLHAFENFGQDDLTAEFVKGQFSAEVDISAYMRDDISFIKNSFNGYVQFSLKNGALIDFPPLVSISKFVFKKRNLDHVTFENLETKLSIQDGKVIIPSLEIESSAIRLNISGVYGLDKGTDIAIAIPLRNPQKDKDRKKRGLKERKNKGIIINLRAQDDDDGKIKIGWDPLNEGKKEIFTEEELKEFEDEEFSMP